MTAHPRSSSDPATGAAAESDPLTGLGTRTMLTRALSAPAAVVGSRTLLLVGLDSFREVNRSLGHAAGDELLIETAQLVRAVAGPGCSAYRLSGDEFALLTDELGEGEAVALAARVLAAIRVPVQLARGEVTLSASIGIAVEEPFADAGQLLGQADTALHRAKSVGGDRCELYTETLRRAGLRREELNAELHRALTRREFTMFYQPELDLRTGRFEGVEALLRWQPADGRHADTAEVIEIAESSGLIVDLGEWTLLQALEDATQLDAGPDSGPTTIAVNVSMHQLLRPGFATTVAQALAACPIDPHRICLEVTETGLAHNPDRVVATLHELRALGVRLAIDDFGTGHASLTYLARFPVDYVKIDRSFIATLGVDPASKVIVGSVADMAHALGMRVIAEGVETASQLESVVAAGCDIAQGYLLARPGAVGTAAARLAEREPWPLAPRPDRVDAVPAHADPARRYRLLLDLARELTGWLDVDEVLARTFSALRQLLSFSGGSIQLIDGDTIGMVAGDPEPTPEALATRIPLGQGVSGRIAVTGEPRYIPDIADDPEISPHRRKRSISGGVRAYFGAPLVAQGEIIGLLQIDSEQPDAFSDEDRFLMLAFTPSVAAALQTARLLAQSATSDAERRPAGAGNAGLTNAVAPPRPRRHGEGAVHEGVAQRPAYVGRGWLDPTTEGV